MSCVLCQHHQYFKISPLRDDNEFHASRCLYCGHTQIDPLPTEEQDKEFYDKDEQTLRIKQETEDVYSYWKEKHREDTERRAQWVKRENVLDIGAGYGFFVEEKKCKGIEPSAERVRLAKTDLIHGSIDEMFVEMHEQEFDALTLFHVLEHMRDPVGFLTLSRRLLRPGGTYYIEVPNLDDEMLTCIPYRDFYYQRAHISYFNEKYLTRCFEMAGFTNFKIEYVQRYGIDNLIHWVTQEKPQQQSLIVHYLYDMINEKYKEMRCQRKGSDTLIAEITV